MKYVNGDLLALAELGEFDIIVHGCNIHHTFGSGIAKQIAEKYPRAYEADLLTKLSDIRKLGKFSVAGMLGGMPFDIVNMYTQKTFGKSGVHVDYKAIEDGFYQLGLILKGDFKVGIPKIGAGLGGGDWDKIVKIIEDVCDLDITCVVYNG